MSVRRKRNSGLCAIKVCLNYFKKDTSLILEMCDRSCKTNRILKSFI